MANQGNEQLCLLVFHCFGILCTVYSCMSIYNLAQDYAALEPEFAPQCKPYAVWKTGFLCHVILFFIAMSFAVGTCDTFLNEEDHEIQEANQEDQREPTTKLIEKSLTVLKINCMFFCGPFILIECILSCAYYTEILKGCQSQIEDPMTATLIYVIIVMGCLSVAACAYCSYMSLICVRAGKRALPSMRQVANWQNERQRMIEENRRRGQHAQDIHRLQQQLNDEDDMLQWQARRDQLQAQLERRNAADSQSSENYSDYSYYSDEEGSAGSSSSYYDTEEESEESQEETDASNQRVESERPADLVDLEANNSNSVNQAVAPGPIN